MFPARPEKTVDAAKDLTCQFQNCGGIHTARKLKIPGSRYVTRDADAAACADGRG